MLNGIDKKFTLVDAIVMQCDNFLRSNTLANNSAARPSPAESVFQESDLTPAERQQSIAMLRVNHSGEVCAQALYQGQAFMAKSKMQQQALLHSAAEENDHLQWCKARLTDLNGKTSILNPFWYAGSYVIGALAGAVGDQVSLGFLAETEHQVTQHLDKHLQQMSSQDYKSRAVLEQMRTDEQQHATAAEIAGAVKLPKVIKFLMRCTSKIMTLSAAKI